MGSLYFLFTDSHSGVRICSVDVLSNTLLFAIVVFVSCMYS
jgi:hypothetical protein